MTMMMPIRVVGTKMLEHSPTAGVKGSTHGSDRSPEVQKGLGDSCRWL